MNTAAVIRSALIPAALLFAVPGFSLWFSGYAGSEYDALFLESVSEGIEADASLSAEERAQANEFYRTFPPSLACADSGDALAPYREDLGEICSDHAQFRFMAILALACIALGLLAALVAGLSAITAYFRPRLQVESFVVGWNVLRVVGALEVLGQGALAVFLSFWMTAIWFESYYVKLILVVGVLALTAVVMVVRAIFQRPGDGIDADGEVLDEPRAPELWGRIRSLCASLGTAPPDHLVVGIDDNFYVTESEVRVAGRELTGRTLYLSLSLMRVLERAEADAVFAHEMAHFLGGDTARSKRLAPMMDRFGIYLGALYENLLARPIYYFMNAYFALFELAVARHRRQRELEADRVAARATSPLDIARSLLKIGAYSSYRSRVEEALFETDAVHADLGITRRVALGFSDYALTEKLQFDMHHAVVPHPYDSHPPLRERIANVGAELPDERYAECLLSPVESSWTESIPEADAIEAQLWGDYEARFAAVHELALAHRYEPANDEERRIVEKHFPPVEFATQDGSGALRFDYEKMHAPEWEAPIEFGSIESATVAEKLLRKHLVLKVRGAGLFSRSPSTCLSKLAVPVDVALDVFNRYYGRHLAMTAQKRERLEEPRSAASA